MNFRRTAIVTSLAMITLASCSSIEKEQANGDFDYVNLKQRPELNVPSGLETPDYSNSYKIPAADTSGPIGEEVRVVSPRQVHPIALGSRVLENEKQARVYFDLVEGMSDSIVNTVWTAAEQVLDRKGLTFTKTGENQWTTELLTTEDEYEAEGDGGWWLLGDGDTTVSLEQSFRYVLTQAPETHGRTTALEVTLADVSQKVNGDRTEMAELTQHNLSVDLLNKVVSQVNRVHQQSIQQSREAGVPVSVSTNAKQQPVFVVELDFDDAWVLTGQALEQIGLSIDDLNREAGTYFVEYTEPDSGFLFIGGDDYESLGIPEGNYEIRLVEFGDDTAISVWSNDEVVDQAWLESVKPALEQALKVASQQ
ncbi:MAG TPA: hypothetical protein DCR58_04050 [Idiomarina baltica]|jgi:outer membrane protein assembly factor BamC|uniref:Outer membrane protein assembly factor BamC n=1 Tax=Idiomarina baltica TaxID=190892 RepID=A0A348WN31_9GAMM|nr:MULTISPECIES: outer membrane protein assembly factor BamC [Idiomarina]MAF76359.1 hypothetical protein [Idiomarinaceae bacterium]MEC8925123.1 outer membrane protein assembly factor BamC [Pseudomonadota bacterium]HAE90923.1 hypothetical protein [Idiomarina sp.]KXS35601.1 MAG: hypothetical protein AWU56_994 [Idiomarina sp. T82-3]MBL73377.1 hypothetical protein [Idiomarinaceae bacterium]|tara:strand:- start:17968 stop:19065 length:1098 start_codon:yes stop_codon:yes gene_type:complete